MSFDAFILIALAISCTVGMFERWRDVKLKEIERDREAIAQGINPFARHHHHHEGTDG
ncbi:hypothetical protein EVB87_086 [Rhizobium phage RHph_N28_1]|nr:hypothetical protein EVB87_086 [Rhizobium phage RHph_N28_1]QIG74114.1 hypothetical protein EVC07_086 [Rhizobium phage RHph_N42]QIG74720.1 hypothetical protein EVC12_085 [Rhizobium phage RHph_I42]QXV73773.1 hypothetical protein [Rhizobium phage RHph_N46]